MSVAVNTRPTSENEKRLTGALREWTVHQPLPPRFAQQVWHKIALLERKPQPWWNSVLQSLLTPKVAYAYVTILVGIGIAAGSWTAQVASDRADTQLSQRYVRAIDPYSMPGR